MPLNYKVLEKIKSLYEIAYQVTNYWVHIELYRCSKYNTSDLKVSVYTFVDEKQAILLSKEIKLESIIAEEEMQAVIDNIKELITPRTNAND